MGGLILTRHPGESVILGNKLVTIKVLNIRGQCVHLHISAPRDLEVNREEIFIKKMMDKAEGVY